MENKLPIEFKTKWLEALRSGEYKQGYHKLERIDNNGNRTYCCLGVACRIMYPEKDLSKLSLIPKTEKTDDFELIPNLIKGDLITNKVVRELTEMNDKDAAGTFPQIAKWVETNL